MKQFSSYFAQSAKITIDSKINFSRIIFGEKNNFFFIKHV